MSHECELCGQWCFCDQEDHGQPQPDDCEHFTRALGCDRDDDWDDEDEGAPPDCYDCDAAPCACERCTHCGLKCERLCIDDTCRAGPCCCDCGPRQIVTAESWWRRAWRWLCGEDAA